MATTAGRGFLGFSGYHWLAIAAAWAGWGFDMFDAVLFNFVAPNCVPTLLGLAPGSAAAHSATVFWTGLISSILLVGWAAGGVLFGWVADRIGRKRAMLATVALYTVGTALCAAATNIWQLIAFRALASLGIGGEWGIGAALVAEAVPENKRVEAGVILQTSSPLGLVMASGVNYLIAGVWFAGVPQTSWRYVFLAGLAPVVLAVFIRIFLRESTHWSAAAAQQRPPSPRELFAPGIRALTISGAGVAVTAVVCWWACNAFIPLLGSTLASEQAAHLGLSAEAARLLSETWKARGSNAFNIGGLLGAFAAIPLSRGFGRRPMFVTYFLYSAAMIFLTFGLDLEPAKRLTMLFWVGAGVYGVFGTFPFYLPELFPARLRATGAGFSYNIGRLIAAGGPLFVGMISARAGGSSAVLNSTLLWVGVIPLIAGLAARYYIVETRGRALQAA
ncbi:MAG TPA: MFS transporter [Steroidobacteraceae bacterium]